MMARIMIRLTFSQRLALNLAVLVAGIVLLGGAAVWGLTGLHRSVDEALKQYRLRQIYEVGLPLVAAREALAADPPSVHRARNALSLAQRRFAALSFEPAEFADLRPRLRRMKDTIHDERIRLALAEVQPFGRDEAEAMIRSINGLVGEMAQLSQAAGAAIDRIQARARNRLTLTTTFMAGATLIVLLGALAVAWGQYRGVMGPLRRLADAVRRIAAGRFDQRLDERGRDELAQLARDFNRMSAELRTLYRELEAKVEQKSRQLVQSERLAGVGFLAAGVAHEINNPLGIITGHAELAERRLQRLGEPPPTDPDPHTRDAVEQARRTLGVIREEAFRCKKITEKLLRLSHGGEEPVREPTDMTRLVTEVADLVRDLPRYRGKTVTLDLGGEPLWVSASPAQMRQVMLNLTVNALAAVEESAGRVTLRGTRADDMIRITVADNGKGMDEVTLERVFQPFYTQRRGSGDPAQRGGGTGLGLSITHAIVTDHGGTLTADSPGADQGSTFTVELPAAGPETAPSA